MNHYYVKWHGNKVDGRWNVIQVLEGQARYFVLKGELEEANTMPFLSHGWIEENSFTDGEEYIPLVDWKKHEGVLIKF